MPKRLPLSDVMRFGDCEISRLKRVLMRSGEPVALQSRPFDLLLYLVDHPGRVISRDELLATVWHGVRVNEQALRFALHAIRRAVGDDGRTQRSIKTVRGSGIQFIAPVHALPHRPPRSPSRDCSFLGRDSFLDSIESSLDSVESGLPSLLLISGDAGIGKTTALLRVASLASQRRFSAALARCTGHEDAPAYWPWAQLIRRLVERYSDTRLTDMVRDRAPELAWVLPELSRMVPQGSLDPTRDARGSRHRLFDAVEVAIRDLARDCPVALCFDDIHEADSPSLALFQHLASELQDARVLFLATFRSHTVSGSRFSSALGGLLRVRGAEALKLSGLSGGDVSLMAQHRSGLKPSSAAVDAILRKTNGNPFFVLQVLKLLESDGRLNCLTKDDRLDLPVPRGVREAILGQTSSLPRPVQGLLALGSVIEEKFSAALLERACGIGATDVFANLQIAVDAGVCVREDGDIEYRFAHSLVRDAINASLSVESRAANNAKVATAMEDLAGADPEARSADIARHFASAHPDPISSRAIRHFVLAARWDAKRAAFDTASVHIGKAVELAARLCPADSELRCELLLEQGVVHALAAERERAKGALTESAGLAVLCDRPDLEARAALAFAPDLLAIETGVVDADLVSLLEKALNRVAKDLPIRARLLARLAVALHWSDEPRLRLRGLVDDAMRIAESQCDSEGRSFVKIASWLALYSVERPYEYIQAARTVRSEDGSTALMCAILRITATWQLARMRDLDIEIDGFRALLMRVQRPSATWYVGMLRASVALMKGRYEEARLLGERFLQDGVKVEDQNALHSFALQRAMMAVDLGGLEELEPAVLDMADRFPRVEGWHAGLSYLLSEVGKVSQSRAIAENLLAQGVLSSFPRNSWLGALGSLSLACREFDDPIIAGRLYERWMPFRRQMAVVGFSSFCWGATDRFMGVLAGLTENWDAAARHFETAATMNRSAGALPALAHTYADQAAMLDRLDPGRGRPLWDKALAVARDLGMRRLERRIVENGV